MDIKVEGDVLLGLSITKHNLLLHLAVDILILFCFKRQLRACDHSCASDGEEVKLCVGGGEVEAGQGRGRGGGQ